MVTESKAHPACRADRQFERDVFLMNIKTPLHVDVGAQGGRVSQVVVGGPRCFGPGQ